MFISENHWYLIQEPTRNEFVTNNDESLVSWEQRGGPGSDTQKFRFVKTETNYYIACKSSPKKFVKVVHIGPGTLHAFRLEETVSRMPFRIINGGEDLVRIQEPTADEYMTVGDNGWIVRWSGGSLFRLIQKEEIAG